jgi:UDP-galactopyranose mutase
LLIGRLAEYKYYDMDDIVERVLEVLDKNFK